MPAIVVTKYTPGIKGIDPLSQLDPVTAVSQSPAAIVASAKLPAKTLAEFVAYGKTAAQPCSLATGESLARISARQLAAEAGIPNLIVVNYRGTGPIVTDLIANNVNLACTGITAALPHYKAGTLKIFATQGTKRAAALPEVPTTAEAGFGQFRAVTWYGLFAPKATPLALFGESDILITSHAWPRFGNAIIRDYLGKHRDVYAFLHDQTVRLMNKGLNGDEIAARLKLPAALEKEWFDRPYYGSLSFNARAVYQFYMGWYDGNPAHLAPMPPADAGKRYVAAMGGAARVQEIAQTAYDSGDYAWAAELLNRVVMADASNAPARQLLAGCYEQLGWQSENALWRNMYLSGARELQSGVAPSMRTSNAQTQTIANLPTASVFDLMAVRLDADKVGAGHLRLAFIFPERNEKIYVTVENGVLIHQAIAAPGTVDATLTLSRSDFLASVFAGVSLEPKISGGQAKVDGASSAFVKLVSWLERPAPNFPLVTR